MPVPSPAQDKLDSYGIDAVCQDIADRKSMQSIAHSQGVSMEAFLRWIETDSNRSARVREVRRWMAKVWDEDAERLIAEAGDDIPATHPNYADARKFALAKAKEMAHHYRWRAKCIAPKEYGEGMTVRGDRDNPLQTETRTRFDLTDAQLLEIAAGAKDDGAG